VECGGLFTLSAAEGPPLFLRWQFSFLMESLGERISGRRQKSGSYAAALQKTKRPGPDRDAKNRQGCCPALQKKSVLGGAGTHFSTEL